MIKRTYDVYVTGEIPDSKQRYLRSFFTEEDVEKYVELWFNNSSSSGDTLEVRITYRGD